MPFVDELVMFNPMMNTPDNFVDSAVQAWHLLADQSFLKVKSSQEKEEERLVLEEESYATVYAGNPYS